MLTKVKNFWVKGVLEKLRHQQVLISLGLEERPDAITSPWNLMPGTEAQQPRKLPPGTSVISVFDRIGAGRTLLILGEPGSGKTISLLQLARDLIDRAELNTDHLIPVVFNLSSWTRSVKRQPFTLADWLVAELNTKYQVSKRLAKDWVEHQHLRLLLDGLDEVRAENRDACVAAINDFQQEQGTEVVVCSRIKDYDRLTHRLNFQSAIYLRSLTQPQIHNYLNCLQTNLTGLRTLLNEDTALQELAQSPLMLNVMVLAYQGVAVEDLPKIYVVEERRKQLFDTYIQRMFDRPNRSKSNSRYSQTQTLRWLHWLSQRMVQKSPTIFLIENMQPSWLRTRTENTTYRIINVLIFGLIFGLSGGLSGGLIFGLSGRLIGEIKLVESLNFSVQGAITGVRNNLIFGLIGGLIFGLIFGLDYGGAACIQHFSLRLLLCYKGRLPWNYARFLDDAVDRLFLQKVGGGYIFVHRLLMEHFAQLQLENEE